MLDSVIDPFGAPTAIHSFLSFEKKREYAYDKDNDGQTFYKIWLGESAKIQQRIRFGVWQALGDIGGFYDGVGLILGSIMSQFAATKFLMELFSGTKVDQ